MLKALLCLETNKHFNSNFGLADVVVFNKILDVVVTADSEEKETMADSSSSDQHRQNPLVYDEISRCNVC